MFLDFFSPTVEGKVDFLQKNFQEMLKKLDRILESHANQEDDTRRASARLKSAIRRPR